MDTDKHRYEGLRSAICNLRLLAGALLLAASTGCLQLDTKIQLHPDGSGTITERVNFSATLLEIADKETPALQLRPLLTKAAATRRMSKMGKGMTLVSHKVQDGAKGSRESISVFRIPQLTDFVYVSPFVDARNPERLHGIKTVIYPVLKQNSSLKNQAGWMGIQFRPYRTGPKLKKRLEPGEKEVKPPSRSPLGSQTYRDLKPMFQDLAQGMEIKVLFEAYAPINKAWSGWRGGSYRTHKVDLLNFTADKDLDRYGYAFLDNEEIMVDLLRWDLESSWIQSNVKDWPGNSTLPAIHHGGDIFFSPSRHYFDKFFKGKTLHYYSHGKARTKPAVFDQIGWKGGKK